jgi:flagellar motility protein MotE (MotC chaperone)
MIKLIVYVLIPLIAFATTVVACLALTGNLSKEQILKIVGKAPAAEQAGEAPKEEADPYLRALQQREDALKKREAKLQESEAQIKKSQTDLDQLKTELEAVQKQIGDTLKNEDADAQKRISDVALSLSKMKPTNAAKTLDSWEAPDAAKVLRMVKDKERGKILDAMTPEKAATILLELKAGKI